MADDVRRQELISEKIDKINLKLFILICQVAVFAIQLYILVNYNNNYIVDADIITKYAQGDFTEELRQYCEIYFAHNPNNLMITYVAICFVHLGRIIGVNGITLMRVAALLLTDLAVSGVVYILDRSRINRIITLLAYAAAVFLLCLNPGASVPYTDTFSIFVPIFMICLYIDMRARGDIDFGEFCLIMLIDSVAILIKPTNIFIGLAIIMIEIFMWLRKQVSTAELCRCVAAFIIAFAFMTVLRFAVLDSFDYEYDERYRKPWTHYAMLGLNIESIGRYNEPDDDYTNRFTTTAQKKEANVEMIKHRLGEMGISGYLRLAVRKTVKSYGDGTFDWVFWGGESDIQFIFMRNIIWYTVVAFAALSYVTGKVLSRSPGELTVELSCLMYFVYLLVFEAGSRYLYHYAPLFILLAAMAAQKIIYALRGENTAILEKYQAIKLFSHKEYGIQLIQLYLMGIWLIFMRKSEIPTLVYLAIFLPGAVGMIICWRAGRPDRRSPGYAYAYIIGDILSVVLAVALCMVNDYIFVGLDGRELIMKLGMSVAGGFVAFRNIVCMACLLCNKKLNNNRIK